jgi:hypothetical protein
MNRQVCCHIAIGPVNDTNVGYHFR